MAKARLVYNFSGVAQDVIITWYEFSAPLAEIDRYVLDDTTDHEKVGAHTVTDLNPVMHRFKFWQSSDGVTLDTLLFSADIDASLFNEPVIEFKEFTVGVADPENPGVPMPGATQYVDADLDDPDITRYEVEQRMFGTLSWEDDIQTISGGGFEFQNGNSFNGDDRYFIKIYKLVAQQVQDVVTQNQFTDIVVLSIDDDFDIHLYNKLLIANWPAGIGLIQLDAMATIPNNTTLHLNTHGGDQRYVTIECQPGETIRFMGEDRTSIHLGKGEEIRIVFKGGAGHVVHYEGDYRQLGERRLGNMAGLNELVLDGTEYDIEDYPRLWEWVQSLPAAQLVSYTTWEIAATENVAGNVRTVYPNKGFFAISNDALKFRVPDDRNKYYRALKYTDGTVDSERVTQGANGYQGPEIMGHGHPIKSTQSAISGNTTADVVRGTVTGTVSTRGGRGKIGDDNYTISITGGSEQRTENIGLIPLIKI
jgi:hypothetical protein